MIAFLCPMGSVRQSMGVYMSSETARGLWLDPVAQLDAQMRLAYWAGFGGLTIQLARRADFRAHVRRRDFLE